MNRVVRVAVPKNPAAPETIPFAVVAMAASVGGLHALSIILGGLPAEFPAAIAVVLTGGDGDGSFGVQIIKDRGGKVVAQDGPTSKDFSMPESSIKTGDVDFVLPLDGIAAKLIELVGDGKKPTKGGGDRQTDDNRRSRGKNREADLCSRNQSCHNHAQEISA